MSINLVHIAFVTASHSRAIQDHNDHNWIEILCDITTRMHQQTSNPVSDGAVRAQPTAISGRWTVVKTVIKHLNVFLRQLLQPRQRRRSICPQSFQLCWIFTARYWTVFISTTTTRQLERRCCIHTAPSFGQQEPTRRAKNTARHVRPSCVRRDWSDRLERTRQRSVRSRSQHRQLRSPT